MNSSKKQYRFYTNCVCAKGDSITDMCDVAKEITFKTFMKHCDLESVLKSFGYAVGNEKGLHLKDDWCVKFYSSVFEGQKCYYMDHSRIEYIFVKGE